MRQAFSYNNNNQKRNTKLRYKKMQFFHPKCTIRLFSVDVTRSLDFSVIFFKNFNGYTSTGRILRNYSLQEKHVDRKVSGVFLETLWLKSSLVYRKLKVIPHMYWKSRARHKDSIFSNWNQNFLDNSITLKKGFLNPPKMCKNSNNNTHFNWL